MVVATSGRRHLLGAAMVQTALHAQANSLHRPLVRVQVGQDQVSRAAQSLSMALMMDSERSVLREQNTIFREGLSDSLHQVKNPIQALRTYGKILQRQVAEARQEETTTTSGVVILSA